MNIGLIDVDNKNWFNYALSKISAYHKLKGDNVEWYDPFATHYDIVYMSKVFTFSLDYEYPILNADKIIKGGTGYDYRIKLPQDIDDMNPDYSIYPHIDKTTAYGFITRGCPNNCKWCIVPKKEGGVAPYRDVDDIAKGGRTNFILMDNNILASVYGINQLKKIVDRGYRVDINQGLDARLVTEDIAQILARIRWLSAIRFGCDTPMQIKEVERAMYLIDSYSKKPKSYYLYMIISDDLNECYERTRHFRDNKRVRIHCQPYRDLNNPNQVILQWQKDMARWADRKEFYATTDFMDFSPRKGFACKEYFNLK